jgi:uncharacterized membrane protein SpoIIM required for sporulation
MPPSIDRFVEERAARWDRLATLVRRGRSGVRSMAPEEVLELGRLYRAASSDLAIAQRDYTEDRATGALNSLVAEAHALVYSESQVTGRAVLDFFGRDLPRIVRENLGYVGLAFGLFAVPAVAAYVFGTLNPALLDTTLPENLRANLERRQLWTDIREELRPFAASAIMTNNIQVSFIAFAGGALAGTLTVFVLVQNGLLFGSVFAATHGAGLLGALLEFVAAHGFVELSVIFLAGGAGFRVASAILDPGEVSRRDALRLRGAQAVRMILGCIPLLALAGLIEGFISPAAIGWQAKAAVGLGTGAALWAYLLVSGRPRTDPG